MTDRSEARDGADELKDDIKAKVGAGREPDNDEDLDEDLEADGEDERWAPEAEPSVEDLARDAGWKPKDKWKGNPAEHVSAAEYLRRLARSQKSLTKKVKERESELKDRDAEFDQRVKRLERANGESRRREIAATVDYFNELLEDAIETGDKKKIRDAVGDRDKALDSLEEGEPELLTDDQVVDRIAADSARTFPTIQKPFWRGHDWLLDEDDKEGCEAFGDFEEVVDEYLRSHVKSKAGPTFEEFERAFAAGERFLKRAYPHRLKQRRDEDEDEDDDMEEREERRDRGKKKPRAEREEGDERKTRRVPVLASGNRSRGKSHSQRLPPEAVKAADADIKAGLFADREEYARVYFKELGEKID